MPIHTKIICSIGPSSLSKEMLKKLAISGMDVARVNMSHGTQETQKKIIDQIKEVRKELCKPIAILLDTKGPEVRVGKLFSKELLTLGLKKIYRLVATATKEDEIPIDPFYPIQNLEVGTKILFNEGFIISKIVKKEKENIFVEIESEGTIKTRAKINIPDVKIDLPAITDKDKADLDFAVKEDIDWIAASFIRSADHLLEIKNFLKKPIPIIAKIENQEGIQNFDSIVEVADGIMVARGDLGVEIDLSFVPQLQKRMILKTLEQYKPVITATQMLESMIVYPKPTRAEVSDVANAIYDSTTAVMLSAETATGKYPEEVVKQMASIIKATELDINFFDVFSRQSKEGFRDISTSVAIAAVKTAYTADAKAIFVFTSSGFTARLISHLRPERPIFALTNCEKTFYQLSLYWGVIPVFVKQCDDYEEAFQILLKEAEKRNLVQFGDIIVMTAGAPFGKPGSTNYMKVESVGSILVRGKFGYGSKEKGKAKIILSPDPKEIKSAQGKIVVINRCDPSFLPFLEKAKGIILQNSIGDSVSENFAISIAQKLNIPLIIQADHATTLIPQDQAIEMDPENGLIY